jgi:hypothetical protein
MPLSFAKKKPADASGTTSQAAAATGGKPAPAWMKKGSAAKAAIQHEAAKAEERKAEQGKLWRFYVKPEQTGQITFLDGDLDKDGDLDILFFYEHRIRINGDWENFACTAENDQSQPCPICETGDKPSLVGVMTVIDHTAHKIQKGPNAGKVIKNTRKLFVAKMPTIDLLRKLANKPGRMGLRGCTFDVMRGDERTAAVGSSFDFVQKFETVAQIMAKYELKAEDVAIADYGEEIRYRTPEELIALGVGKAVTGPGTSSGAASKALADQL